MNLVDINNFFLSQYFLLLVISNILIDFTTQSFSMYDR